MSTSSSLSLTPLEGRIRQLEIQLGLSSSSSSLYSNTSKTSTDEQHHDHDIEHRLHNLERYLWEGGTSTSTTTASSSNNNTTTTNVTQPSNNHTNTNNATVDVTTGVVNNANSSNTTTQMTHHDIMSMIHIWNEIDKLIEELSPGTALTHQNKSGVNTAPILYRKQEILSTSDQFKTDMNYISNIVQTLSIDNNNNNNNNEINHTNHNIITEQQVVNAPIILNTTIVTTEQQVRLDQLCDKFNIIQNRIINASQSFDYMIYHYQQLIQSMSEQLILYHESIDIIHV